MERVDPSVLMAALAGSSLYVSLLPPLSEVRRAETDSATARDVRQGIGMASAALVGAGAIIGLAERSTGPLVFTLAMAGLMGAIYEVTLRQRPESPAPELGNNPVTPPRRYT